MTDFWKGKNVLVTGISGFVGSCVASRLRGLGANVVGIVKNIRGDRVPPASKIVIGDITDYDLVRQTISENEIEYIYHFAAYAIVRISARDPMTTYSVNVMGTTALLEAARVVGRCRSIVVASSDKAYGDHDVLPYREDFALRPKNTYDTSKACMDLIAQSYAHNYGLPIVVTRCSNIYGPGDYNLSRIVPNTICRALAGQRPMLYSDIESMEREFIFIDDVVDAYEVLGRTEVPSGSAFNVGGAGPVKISILATMICGHAGRPDLQPEIVPREETFKEIKRQFIDASKLTTATGWRPQTYLQEGLARSVEWYKGLA